MAKEKLFDIERIKALVSVEMVCDKLGLETKPIGRRISVLCPFHGDTHFGNAFIFIRLSFHRLSVPFSREKPS